MKNLKIAARFLGLLMLFTSFTFLGDWIVVEEADFRIEFPSKPIEEEQNMESAIGPLKLNIRMFEVEDVEKDDNFVYGMITTQYPPNTIHSDSTEMIDQIFEGAINGSTENVKGKLLSQKKIEMKGYPGREFRIDFQEGLAVIKMRAILVKNKMFILQIITDPKKEGNKAAARFFDSFQLK